MRYGLIYLSVIIGSLFSGLFGVERTIADWHRCGGFQMKGQTVGIRKLFLSPIAAMCCIMYMSCISPSIQITYDFIHHAHLCAENLSYKSECRQILPRNPLQTHISIFLSCDSIHFLFLSYLIFFRSCVLWRSAHCEK